MAEGENFELHVPRLHDPEVIKRTRRLAREGLIVPDFTDNFEDKPRVAVPEQYSTDQLEGTPAHKEPQESLLGYTTLDNL